MLEKSYWGFKNVRYRSDVGLLRSFNVSDSLEKECEGVYYEQKRYCTSCKVN